MKTFLLLNLIGFMHFSARAEQITLKFDEIGAMVSDNNQHAKAAALQRKAVEAGKGHLRRSFLPHVQARAGGETFKTGSQKQRSEPFGAIEGKINLYRGGRDRLEEKSVSVKSEAAGREADQALREEIRKARVSYWELISERESIALLETAKNENVRNQKAAQTRIRAGMATSTDRIEFEMHQMALEQDLARAQLSAANIERNLAILLGLSAGTTISTEKSVGHQHTDQLLSAKVNVLEHPSVALLSLQAEGAALERSRLRRWWTPSLDLYAGYNLHTFRDREYDPQSERGETAAGLQLSFELFDGLKSRREADQQNLLAQGLRFEYLQTARELDAQIEAARAELKLTHDLIHQSEEALKSADQYLVRTLDEYRRGVKNSPDVLSASERNLQMKRRFAELRRDYQLARVELLGILGQ